MDKPKSADSTSDEPRTKSRKPYRRPSLTAYGEVRTLTQTSTSGSVEKNPTGSPPFMA